MRKSYLPAASQPWGADVERAIAEMQKRIDRVDGKASTTESTLAQVMPTIGYTNVVSEAINSVASNVSFVEGVSIDAVTWKTVDPVQYPGTDETSADIPTHPNAVWFTVDEDGNTQKIWQWMPSNTYLKVGDEGYTPGTWVNQMLDTTAISPEAITADLLAQSVSDDIETAKSGAAAAQTAADNANTAAATAQSAADSAQEAAAAAAGVAAGKGRVIFSDTMPSGADNNVNNLWINTTGGANTPNKFNGTAWVAVTDRVAVDAAAAAVAAQTKAYQAFVKAQDATDAATAAGLAADHAQTTADGKNTVFYSATKPSLTGCVDGDQWYNTDDGNKLYIYKASASDFVLMQFGTNAIATNSITATSGIVASLDAGKITAGTLSADRIAAGSLTAAKLATGTITAASGIIADAAITDAKIANGTISNAKIANIDAGKITTGTINAARISANSITADKLNANVFNAQTITGSVFTAGGDSLPKILVGPLSGQIGTGDSYGVQITTPNSNANGSATLGVSPIGPYLEFYDGAGKQSLYADKTGIKVPNRYGGGMVDISMLMTNTLSWVMPTSDISLQFSANSGSMWGVPRYFRTPRASKPIYSVGKVSSTTGRMLVYSGVSISAPDTDQLGLEVQWQLLKVDPSGKGETDTGSDTQGFSFAEARADVGGTGLTTVGMELVSLPANTEFWLTPKYWQYNLSNTPVRRALTRLWVYVTPAP